MLDRALGKYGTIIVSVALFLVFDLGVLVLNFYTAAQISKDAVAVNLAGRQRMLSQRISKTALQIQDQLNANQPFASQVTEITNAADLFERTLTAFDRGGETTGGDGKPVQLEAVTQENKQTILEEAKTLFAPILASVRAVKNQTDANTVGELVRNTNSNNLRLLDLMNKLTTSIEDASKATADRLRMAQIIGIGLALVNFAILLFHFLRKLRENDRAIEAAKKETDDILRTTQEGLFLLDPTYNMGSQHSEALTQLVGTGDVAGRNFLEMIRPVVTPKTLNTAKEYIDLLLDSSVNEKLVQSLNPLDSVELNLTGKSGQADTRYLQFKFNRVYENDKITHLLVTAADITKRISLEQELKASEAKAESQMSMMVKVLQIEPAALNQYLAQMGSGLDAINEQLRERSVGAGLRTKLDQIFRITHRLKGDAAAIGLDKFADSFHQIEEDLQTIKKKMNPVGEDFLPITVRARELFGERDNILSLVQHITQTRSAAAMNPMLSSSTSEAERSAAAAPSGPAFVQRWQAFASGVAQRQGKEVELSYRGVDVDSLPNEIRDGLQSIVSQLIRNAVVHGVEAPTDRARRGKATAGRIAIYLIRRSDEGLDFSFRDDGHGLDLENIRRAAVSKNLIKDGDAFDMRQAVATLFAPGFSTRSLADGDGGRGAGLDVVKELVSRLGGQIRLASTTGEYCQFRVSLPPPKQTASGPIGALTPSMGT
jgi:two-component system, chemotaxis family, sensor kinase CheA